MKKTSVLVLSIISIVCAVILIAIFGLSLGMASQRISAGVIPAENTATFYSSLVLITLSGVLSILSSGLCISVYAKGGKAAAAAALVLGIAAACAGIIGVLLVTLFLFLLPLIAIAPVLALIASAMARAQPGTNRR